MRRLVVWLNLRRYRRRRGWHMPPELRAAQFRSAAWRDNDPPDGAPERP